jgi:hypothetical protein
MPLDVATCYNRHERMTFNDPNCHDERCDIVDHVQGRSRLASGAGARPDSGEHYCTIKYAPCSTLRLSHKRTIDVRVDGARGAPVRCSWGMHCGSWKATPHEQSTSTSRVPSYTLTVSSTRTFIVRRRNGPAVDVNGTAEIVSGDVVRGTETSALRQFSTSVP